MPLVWRREAFDHPDWIFEIKHDVFGAVAYIELRASAPAGRQVGQGNFRSTSWIFEIKHDGFRAIAYVDRGKRASSLAQASPFQELRESLPLDLNVWDAILDDETVHIGQDGRAEFI
jgi:hypothetical protein